MSKMLTGRLLLTSAALALSACGGGGGGGSHVSSTPPPTQTPTTQTCWDGSVIPTTATCPPQTQTCPDGSVIPASDTCPPPPPPPASPQIFPSVTDDTEFAVLGLAGWEKDGFSVRYDAATQGYLINTPSTSERFIKTSENSLFWYDSSGWTNYDQTGSNDWAIFKPTSTNPEIQLAYTSFGTYTAGHCTDYGSTCFLDELDFFAFGLPTPSSGIPVTGTATYDAYAAGYVAGVTGHEPIGSIGNIGGGATLQFDFGAGTLAGHFDPILYSDGGQTSLGTYNFVNTVFGVGSTSFSGSLSHSGTDALGAFDGQFTGPAAQELMARWTAPYQDPANQQSYNMFGVWVGKRQ